MDGNAVLLLEKIICYSESSGTGSDDVYLEIHIDENFYRYWPGDDHRDDHVNMDSGDNRYVDINFEVSFNSSIKIIVWDYDTADDDKLGEFNIARVYNLEEEGELRDPGAPRDEAEYGITYRVIKNPIKTLRVHGIRCQKASLGINMDVVNNITGALEECAGVASDVFDEIKRPKAELISDAFDAVSKVLAGLPYVIEWIAEALDNPDEVFMIRLDPTSDAAEGGFFPPGSEDYYNMIDGDEVCFEEKYGQYFRFPLDQGKVRIQIREYDPIKTNISLGEVEIDPTTHPMDEPAKVLTACIPYDYDGNNQGAIYHLCYSVGLDDWLKPATADVQNALSL